MSEVKAVSRTGYRFTPEESRTIIALKEQGISYHEIAERMGRNKKSIVNFFHLRGLTSVQAWSDDELAMLKSAYESAGHGPLDLNAVAKSIGRSRAAVATMAQKLGLTDQKRKRVLELKKRRKYETDVELRAAISESRRKWIQDHGHPRGAAGLRHTPEAKAQMREASLRFWAEVTPQELEQAYMKRRLTNIERYGTASPVQVVSENPYSRTRSGKREDLGGRFFRSSWEANYARYLNWLIDQGEIKSWEYEADTFVFHGETRGAITYRPDFKITERDGTVVYHEVKGWMDGPSKTRLKRMKKHYPDVTVIVIGEDEYKAISKWRGMLPEWEGA